MRRGGEEPRVGCVRDMVGLDLLQRVVCHERPGDAGWNKMNMLVGKP